MALLQGFECKAYVEVAKNDQDWKGYVIISNPDPADAFKFASATSSVFYKGPVLQNGEYCLATGDVHLTNSHYSADLSTLRVDFVGVSELNIVKRLSRKPKDFMGNVAFGQ
jgi:hypothetical protein